MTTRWPFFKRMSRTCAAMKPEPPVRRTRVMVVGVVVGSARAISRFRALRGAVGGSGGRSASTIIFSRGRRSCGWGMGMRVGWVDAPCLGSRSRWGRGVGSWGRPWRPPRRGAGAADTVAIAIVSCGLRAPRRKEDAPRAGRGAARGGSRRRACLAAAAGATCLPAVTNTRARVHTHSQSVSVRSLGWGGVGAPGGRHRRGRATRSWGGSRAGSRG